MAINLAIIAGGAVIIGLVLYWQLVVAEGAYLGQGIVTFLYDVTAKRYNNIKQFDRRIESTFLGAPLVKALKTNVGASVLDIGAGTGRLALTLFEQPSFQGRVIGIDASLQMLRVAARSLQQYASRITLICRDAADLPFGLNSFDVVTCLEMLEFTPDPKHQVSEAFRVLQPGGFLLLTRRRGLDALLMPGKTHAPDEFESLLQNVGFEQVQRQIWQVDYDLYWAHKPGSPYAVSRQFIELVRCTYCNSRQLYEFDGELLCKNCSQRFPIFDGIIDMRQEN